MSDQTPDLVARLRHKSPTVQEAMSNSREAADEIEKLRAMILECHTYECTDSTRRGFAGCDCRAGS